jgi:hypothetical protein
MWEPRRLTTLWPSRPVTGIALLLPLLGMLDALSCTLASFRDDPGSDLCHPDSDFPGLPLSLQEFGQDWLVGKISNAVFAAVL